MEFARRKRSRRKSNNNDKPPDILNDEWSSEKGSAKRKNEFTKMSEGTKKTENFQKDVNSGSETYENDQKKVPEKVNSLDEAKLTETNSKNQGDATLSSQTPKNKEIPTMEQKTSKETKARQGIRETENIGSQFSADQVGGSERDTAVNDEDEASARLLASILVEKLEIQKPPPNFNDQTMNDMTSSNEQTATHKGSVTLPQRVAQTRNVPQMSGLHKNFTQDPSSEMDLEKKKFMDGKSTEPHNGGAPQQNNRGAPIREDNRETSTHAKPTQEHTGDTSNPLQKQKGFAPQHSKEGAQNREEKEKTKTHEQPSQEQDDIIMEQLGDTTVNIQQKGFAPQHSMEGAQNREGKEQTKKHEQFTQEEKEDITMEHEGAQTREEEST